MRNKKKFAVVYCNGGSRAKKKDVAQGFIEGTLECEAGCPGDGKCVDACKFGAIEINSIGVAEVNKEKCIGCGVCVKVCPKSLIRLVPVDTTIVPKCNNCDNAAEARKVCEVSCIACRICERNCPVNAISMLDNHAVIDSEVCISCGMCAMKCPRGTIIDLDGIFTQS